MNTSDPDGETDRHLLQKPKGLRSRIVIQLNLFSLLLFLCLWLPVARGCNGSLVYPINTLQSVSTLPAELPGSVASLAVLGTYAEPLINGLLFATCAWKVSRNLWWKSFLLTYYFCLAIALIGFIGEVAKTSCDLHAMLKLIFFSIIPFGVAVWWIGLRPQIERGERAWARWQYTWMLGAVYCVHMQCVFGNVNVGYFVGLFAIVGIVFSVEAASRRMQHDLWDPLQVIRPFQFTLRNTFVWMTLPPLAFGYFQFIDRGLDWLFGKH